MKLPDHLEDVIRKLGALPGLANSVQPIRMLIECAYMAGVTASYELAKADPTLTTLTRHGTECAVSSLDAMNEFFLGANKEPAS